MVLTNLLIDIKREFPKFGLVKKSDSRLMKAIDIFLRIVTFNQQKVFLTKYTTTLNTTVYLGNDWDKMSSVNKAILLRHERVHMCQARRYSIIMFAIMYILIPLPFLFAYCRMMFEKEAYKETMIASYQYHGKGFVTSNNFKQFIVNQFTTAAYGWMWILKPQVEKWFDKMLAEMLEQDNSQDKITTATGSLG